MILVRECSINDALTVARHVSASEDECASFRGEIVPQPESVCSLLAEVDGAVVGSVSLVVDAVTVRVTHLYVITAARAVGVGTTLLRAAIDRGRASGATRVSCDVQPGNRRMKNLLEQQGITAVLIRAERNLD